jgi:DNA-binding NarL/FixJ family response regulator
VGRDIPRLPLAHPEPYRGLAVVRVLTVDDHASFRRAARALVSATDGFEEVGEVATAEQAIDAVGRLTPDLVLMDVRLPGIDGREASRRIVESHPDIVVVLVSSADDDLLRDESATCGAATVLRKDTLRPSMLLDVWETNRPDRGGQSTGARGGDRPDPRLESDPT